MQGTIDQLQADISGVRGVVVSPYMKGLLDDPDAATARQDLGVYSRAEADAAMADHAYAKNEVYTKGETDAAIAGYAYSKGETDSRLASLLEGLITSKITWESSTTLRIEDGLFHVNNLTRDDIFVLENPLTGWTPDYLSGPGWHYVYLDPPSSGTALGPSNFTVAGTPPTYTQRKGWYDASNRRCVGVFYVNSGNAIPRFDIVHGWWVWRSNNALILHTSSPSSSVVGVATNTPALGRKLLNLVIRTDANNAADYSLFFYTDSYVASATRVQRATNTGSPWVTPVLWYTGGDGKLYYKAVWGGGGTLDIRWTGMQLPVGLRRTC